MTKTRGRRIDAPPDSWPAGECPYRPGDYWKAADGTWHGETPNGLAVWLANHHVEEHEDGTISVLAGPWGSNSILAMPSKNDPTQWHGFIRRGVWEER